MRFTKLGHSCVRLEKDGAVLVSTLAPALNPELVDALAVCGTPSECAERIRAKVGDVADRVALFTPVAPTRAII